MQWGAYSENENCLNDLDLKTINEKFGGEMVKWGKRYAFEQRIGKVYEDEPDSIQDRKIHYNIIPFLFCDNGYITVRAFVLSPKRKNKLIDEFGITGYYNTDSIVLLIAERIAKHRYVAQITDDTYFQECIFLGKIEYYYNQRNKTRSYKPVPVKKIDPSKKYSIPDLVEAIQLYFQGDDPGGKYIIKLHRAGNKKDPDTKAERSLAKLKNTKDEATGSKLKTWQLVDAIHYFEEYRTNPNPNEGVPNALLSKVGKIKEDDSEFLEEEYEYCIGKLNYDSIVTIFSKNVSLLYDCEDIKIKIADLQRTNRIDELAILYFDMLHTEDITSLAADSDKAINKNLPPCAGISKVAFEWCKNFLIEKKKKKKKTVDAGNKAFLKKKYPLAKDSYLQALKINKGLSAFPQFMLDSIARMNGNTEKNLAEITDRIVGRRYNANMAIPGILNQRWDSYTKSNKEVVYDFSPGPNFFKGWFVEFKYRKGLYFSSNDNVLAENLAMTIAQIYKELSPEVAKITVTLTGSADMTKFISDNPIKIVHEEYKGIDNLVCDCLLKESPDNCPPFPELRDGKIRTQLKNVNYKNADSNYLRNNALAYLRAYHRMALIRKALGGVIPGNKIEFVVCAKVANVEGEDSRYVNVELNIRYK